jgi:hypothetical protein
MSRQLRQLVKLIGTIGVIGGFFSCTSQTKPEITVSPDRVPHRSHVDMRGTGFTPNQNVSSHLRRPDGTEYPVLPMLTDARGEFRHDIDTMVLNLGAHEVWVVDDTTKASSNVARFDVTID